MINCCVFIVVLWRFSIVAACYCVSVILYSPLLFGRIIVRSWFHWCSIAPSIWYSRFSVLSRFHNRIFAFSLSFYRVFNFAFSYKWTVECSLSYHWLFVIRLKKDLQKRQVYQINMSETSIVVLQISMFEHAHALR